MFLVQAIQEVGHLAGRGIVVDGIVTGIRSQLIEHVGIVIALAAIVQLHDPALLMIDGSHMSHEGGLELQFLFLGYRIAGQAGSEDLLNLFLAGRSIHDVFQSMVRGLAAHGTEEVDAAVEGSAEILEGSDLSAAGLFQAGEVIEIVRLFNVVGLVRTEARYDHGLDGLVFL